MNTRETHLIVVQKIKVALFKFVLYIINIYMQFLRKGAELLITIMKVTEKEIHLLKKAANQFFKPDVSQEQLKAYINKPQNWAYIAIGSNDEILGFAFGYVLESFYSTPELYMHSIDVVEQYKRQGIGKLLMNKILEDCKEKGFKELFLVTNKGNIPAVRLYESTGGTAPDEDNVVYSWEIENV